MSKPRRILAVLAFAVALALGAAPAAFADEGEGGGDQLVPTMQVNGNADELTLELTSRLEMPLNGLSIPISGLAFEFEITALPDSPPESPQPEKSRVGTAYLQIDRFDQSNDTVIKHNDKDIQFTFKNFPHAGEYSYRVSPIKGEANPIQGSNLLVTYSEDVYIVRIRVMNDGGELKIASVTAEHALTGEGTGEKVSQILFKSHCSMTSDVSISKEVVGDYGDKTKAFQFSIALLAVPVFQPQDSDEVSIKGKIGGEEVEVPLSNDPHNPYLVNFNLADGQTLEFTDIPVGARLEVAETLDPEKKYEASVVTVENGVSRTGEDEAGKADSYHLWAQGELGNCIIFVGEHENHVAFTNSYDDNFSPLTGVIMRNAPFAALLGLGIAALVALAVVKRRRAQRLR